jgi:hypothetical protein
VFLEAGYRPFNLEYTKAMKKRTPARSTMVAPDARFR